MIKNHNLFSLQGNGEFKSTSYTPKSLEDKLAQERLGDGPKVYSSVNNALIPISPKQLVLVPQSPQNTENFSNLSIKSSNLAQMDLNEFPSFENIPTSKIKFTLSTSPVFPESFLRETEREQIDIRMRNSIEIKPNVSSAFSLIKNDNNKVDINQFIPNKSQVPVYTINRF